MSTRVTGASAPPASSAQGPGSSNPNASARFRAALDRAKAQSKPDERKASRPLGREPRKDKPSAAQGAPLEAQGGLVITPMGIASGLGAAAPKSTPSAAASASTGARAERAAAIEAASEQQESDGALAITDVRVGRGGGAVRVHATLAQGEHQGVELRAVEKNGRIEVELRAADSAAAERLRGEVSALRESLEAQGIDRVAVAVVDASRSSSGSHGFSQGESRHPREGATDGQEAESVDSPRRAAGVAAPARDERGEESGDGRELLL